MKIIHFIKKYLFIIGLIVFAIIIFQSNPEKIIENIKNIKPIYLIVTVAIFVPYLIMKVFCWDYILRKQGIKYKFKDLFLMYCSGLYMGILTPGRTGEIAKALYLNKDGYSMGKSMVGITLDRISDFAFLIIFIFLGSLFYITIFQKQILIFICGMVIAIILFVIGLKTGLLKLFFKKLFGFLVSEKNQKSWQINFQDFVNDLKIYKPKDYLIISLITIVYWLFYYLMAFVLAVGLGIHVPILYFAISITVAGLITLIPISISGIGTRDAAIFTLFAPFAVGIEKVVALSALILFIAFFTALIGLFCWLIKPIKL